MVYGLLPAVAGSWLKVGYMSKHLAWDRQQGDGPITAAFRFRAFAVIQGDENSVFPIGRDLAGSPHATKQEV